MWNRKYLNIAMQLPLRRESVSASRCWCAEWCAASSRCRRGRYTACAGSDTAGSSWLGSVVSGAYFDEPTYLYTVGGLNTNDQS